MSVNWETARNRCEMFDPGGWEEYWNYNQSTDSASTNQSKKSEELPCTCDDNQYEAVASTGQGFSDTCPYHTEWAKERRRRERGL
jgi:hypothetical protein